MLFYYCKISLENINFDNIFGYGFSSSVLIGGILESVIEILYCNFNNINSSIIIQAYFLLDILIFNTNFFNISNTGFNYRSDFKHLEIF